jgi:hypothetical protein
MCIRKQCDSFQGDVVEGAGGTYSEVIDGTGAQIVTFTCRNGFAASGSGSFIATCDPDAPCAVEWNNVQDCECVDCTGLTIPNSNVNDASTCAEQSVPVTCDDGYCAGGDGVFDVECTGVAPAAVAWTGIETCQAVTCNPIVIANGVYSGSYSTGDSAQVTCDAGYRVAGSEHTSTFTIDCVPNDLCSSNWDTHGATCEPAPCDDITIANTELGTYSTGSNSVSAEDYFTCASGFEPTSDSDSCQITRQCIPLSPGYSTWSGEAECVRVECDAPTGDYYGDYSEEVLDNIQFGTVTCQSGYATSGSASFEAACVPNGACERTWDSLGDCECVECPPAYFSYSQFHFDAADACTTDTQVVDCDDGYCSADGDTFTITCEAQAPAAVAWDNLLTCDPVSCGEISFINSDQTESVSGVTGDEFEVNCDYGHSHGDCTAWMVQCVATGPCTSAWTHADMVCLPDNYVAPIIEPVIGECNLPNENVYYLHDTAITADVESTTEIPVEISCQGTISDDYNPIEEICINIEHSYVDDLRMELFCPDNFRSVILMAGRELTTGAYFGQACDENNHGCELADHGVGWEYCFVREADSAIYDAPYACTGSCYGPGVPGSCCDPEKYQIPSGSYQTIENFGNFVGCDLAGVWNLVITDSRENDDGYVYSVTIGLD